jgi:hypothetical protein
MPERERLAILLSFAGTSVLGAWLIFSRWLTRDAAAAAYIRATGFVGIMAGVHFVAFRMYQRQGAPARPPAVVPHMMRRVAWSVPACVFFLMAVGQFVVGQQLRTRILASGRSLDSVPPTVLGHYSALGVALASFGATCLLVGFCSRTGGQRKPDTEVIQTTVSGMQNEDA